MLPRMLEMVDVPPHPPERFESVLEPEPFEKLAHGIRTARELLGERTVWNVSSTAKGGGVVELLLPLIGYAKGAGVDARWAVIEGNPEFFKVTKRIHNLLHGFEGDGGDLDDEARKVYEDALEPNARELVELVDADDVVLLHDPQTAGLIGPLKRTGAKVIWRCHIGIDEPNDIARARLGLPARRRRAGRRLRVLARGVRVGGPRRRQGRGHRALDRRLQRQEPGARARAGATRSSPPPGSSTAATASRPSSAATAARRASRARPSCTRTAA